MMSMIITVLTPFTGLGTQENPFIPEVVQDYGTQIKRFSDITGQDMYPDPNLFVIEVQCESAILDLIEGDSKYYVISSEEIV